MTDKPTVPPMTSPELLPEDADERRMFDRSAELHGGPLVAIAAAMYVQRGIVSQPGASFYEQSTIHYNELVKAHVTLTRAPSTVGVEARERIAFDLFKASFPYLMDHVEPFKRALLPDSGNTVGMTIVEGVRHAFEAADIAIRSLSPTIASEKENK